MTTPALIHALQLDRQGGCRVLSWQDIQQPLPADQLHWIHLDYEHPDSAEWLKRFSGLQMLEIESLLAEDSRPRCVSFQQSLIINLRGVNTNPGAEPEDMVAIRMVCQQNLLISSRRRRLLSVQDIAQSLEHGDGPRTSGELCSALTRRMVERMRTVINEIDEKIDNLEDAIINDNPSGLRSELLLLRREIIQLRRYLSPQREALAQLQAQTVSWLTDRDRLAVREAADQLLRYLEDLDSSRDRAIVVQEELTNKLADALNSRMYLLSIVTALFLPLGFITGLFGINVGGIPLADNPAGFIIVSSLLTLIVVLQIVIFRNKRWF